MMRNQMYGQCWLNEERETYTNIEQDKCDEFR